MDTWVQRQAAAAGKADLGQGPLGDVGLEGPAGVVEEEAHAERCEALVRALVHVRPEVQEKADDVAVTVRLEGDKDSWWRWGRAGGPSEGHHGRLCKLVMELGEGTRPRPPLPVGHTGQVPSRSPPGAGVDLCRTPVPLPPQRCPLSAFLRAPARWQWGLTAAAASTV